MATLAATLSVVAPAAALSAHAAAPAVASKPDAVSAQLAARAQGSRVLVSDDTTAMSQTYANPDGTFTVEQSSGPERVQRSDGSWTPIDLSLQAQRDGSLAPAAAPDAVSFSGGGDTTAASLATGSGQSFGLGWLSKLPAPNVSGGVATYQLSATMSLQLAATSQGFTAHLILTAPPTGSFAPRLPLTLSKLSATQTADGAITLSDVAGHELAHADRFVMWDSQANSVGDPTNVSNIPASLQTVNGRQELDLSPSMSWLTDPSTVYPVTIDPDVSALSLGSTTYVNSANVNTNYSSSVLLDVGSPNGSTEQRAIVRFPDTQVVGTDIESATLTLRQHYAATCTAKQTNAIAISTASTNVTWANQPGVNTSYLSSASGNHGASGCAGADQSWDVKSIVSAWASGAIADNGIELRASNEIDSTGEKRFCSKYFDSSLTYCNNATTEPSLSVTYNRYPGTAYGQNPPTGTATHSATLSALVTDPDGGSAAPHAGQVEGVFFVQDVSAGNAWVANWASGSWVPSGQQSTYTVPGLISGHTYQWQALGYDGTDTSHTGTPWNTFVYDTQAPSVPSVTADNYTAGTWTAGNPNGTFTFAATDSGGAGVDHYLYGLDTPTPESSTAKGSATTGAISVPGGWHTIYVRAVDAAGNLSPVSQFSFGAGAGMVTPSDGGTTEHSVTLSATTAPGATQVTYYYRQATGDAWQQVPTSDVTASGANPAFTGWPYGFTAWTGNSGAAPGLVWNVSSTLNATSGPVQVAACFGDGTTCTTNPGTGLPSGSSPAVNVTFDRNGFYADTQNIGPGTVNLLTGNLGLNATDVDVPGTNGTDLSVQRSFNTFTAATATGVMGSGWTMSLPVGTADNNYLGLSDIGNVLNLANPDGSVTSFARSSTTSSTYKPTGDAADSGLIITSGGTGCASSYGCYTLTDLDNNTTVFQSVAASPPTGSTSAPTSYVQISASQPGNAMITSYTETNGRYTKIIAPTPAGATCVDVTSTWTAGCRGLLFTYNGSGQLTAVTYATSDGTNPLQVDVACYSYNSLGQLAQQWDPRDIQNPNGPSGHPIVCDPNNPVRPTSYTYDGQGRIATIGTANLDTTSFTYASSDPSAPLTKLTDSSGSASYDTHLFYGVALSSDSSSDRPDVTAGTTATWAQTDDPDSTVGGTAVCPPGVAPSGATGNLQGCTISYVDPQGLTVNTVDYSNGWNITTSEHDSLGHVIRTLTADDRAEALNPTSGAGAALGLPADTATAALDLSTVNEYVNDVDGQPNLTDTFGPYHQIELANGAVVDARTHTANSYDTGSKDEIGHPVDGSGQEIPQHLVVKTVEGASLSPDPVVTSETDDRETDYDYWNGNDTSGWTFATPLQTITDPASGGLQLTSTTALDPVTGNVIAVSQPSDTSGSGVGTTKTEYYSAGSNSDSDCANKPLWAGMVCKTLPAAQPTVSGLPGLATTWTSGYDYLGRPTTVKEMVNDANGVQQTRITTTSYGFNSTANPYSGDVYSTAVTGGVGTAMPTVTTTYDPGTGLATSSAAAAAGPNPASATATGYDGFGRVISYIDNTAATGAQANTATTTYDPATGFVDKTVDAHTTTSFSYNQNGETRGLPTSEQVSVNGSTPYSGTWTASYDADGNLASETDPNGISTKWAVDETGQQVSETATTSSGGAWLTDTAIPSVHGQWLHHGGLAGSQDYTYDAAGRLTQAVDSTANGTCAIRSYTYDADSNRLTSTSIPSNSDGSCQTTQPYTGAVTTSHGPYSADRLPPTGSDTGLSYDAYGRITGLPAADATGGAMTLGYYVNDLAYSQTQGTTTQCFGLDAQLRLATSTSYSATSCTGPLTAATTNHYDDSSDSPTWIAENNGVSTWTANATDLGGALAATVNQAGTATYQYTDLHGNITATAAAGNSTPTVAPDYDEFGNDPTAAGARYGWLGAKQRSAQDLGGLVLMGVRQYNPLLGRFLQTDPVPGGSANAYDYVMQDPINGFDLDGRCWSGFGWACSAAHQVAHAASATGRFLDRHSGAISTGLGVAVLFVPGADLASPLLLASAGFGGISGYRNLRRHDYAGAAMDFVGAGAGAAELGLRAGAEGLRFLKYARGVRALSHGAARASRLGSAALFASAYVSAQNRKRELYGY